MEKFIQLQKRTNLVLSNVGITKNGIKCVPETQYGVQGHTRKISNCFIGTAGNKQKFLAYRLNGFQFFLAVKCWVSICPLKPARIYLNLKARKPIKESLGYI